MGKEQGTSIFVLLRDLTQKLKNTLNTTWTELRLNKCPRQDIWRASFSDPAPSRTELLVVPVVAESLLHTEAPAPVPLTRREALPGA